MWQRAMTLKQLMDILGATWDEEAIENIENVLEAVAGSDDDGEKVIITEELVK